MQQTAIFMRALTKYFTLVLVLLSYHALDAQNSEVFNFDKVASVNLSDFPASWHAKVYSVEAPYPGSDSYRNYIHQLKRLQYEDRVVPQGAAKSVKATNASKPINTLGFEANFFGGIPNDNDIAVSNDGMLVSVSNSDMFVYNENGVKLLDIGLDAFADSISLVANSYDPKVIYDPIEDRFILIFLNGNDESATAIVVCFSQTNDPTQGWNIYSLTGNPFNNQAWSDFPMIAMTNQDFFVTVNHIHSDSASWQTGFMQSVIWQVQKSEGYSGGTIKSVVHSGINYNNKPIRNLLPIQGGFSLKDDEMYFLSNRNFDLTNDTFFVVKISESLDQNINPSTVVSAVLSDQNYGLPPDAQQTISTFLQTNDGRPLSGLIENGIIHFVGNTVNFNTNLASIFHGKLNVLESTLVVDLEIIGDNSLEYGYPNLSFTGQSPFDEQLIISFNHTSIDSFPGVSAIFYSNTNGYSDRLHLASGSSNVNVISGNFERWGDYSGSQKKYNEPGVVWISGFIGFKNNFAVNSNQHRSFVAKLESPESTATSIQEAFYTDAIVFPNPVQNSFSLEFELQESMLIDFKIYDTHGVLVENLMRRNVKKGKNALVFSTERLAPGVYFLQLTNEANETILQNKLLKQ